MIDFPLQEARIRDLQQWMETGEQTSVSLTSLYMQRIAEIDQDGPMLRSVIELNPDAIYMATQMDQERAQGHVRSELHGIPVLIKDNINTGDHMHTSAGSLALADSFAPEDAFLVNQLRNAGAVILGKTNLTEMANFMAFNMQNGYSARGGQTLNPYGPGRLDVGGSSAGSGAAVAANLCAVAVGTETSGSILNPSGKNSLVGIKPTLGLISRTGIVPITYTQDTAGPMARNVEDAAILLSALTGKDEQDVSTQISPTPALDYTDYLDPEGLRGARIGINRAFEQQCSDEEKSIIEASIEAMYHAGAVIIEHTDLPAIVSEDMTVLLYEFKSALNSYLSTLGAHSRIRTLQDMIDYNHLHHQDALKYGQEILIKAQYETSGTLTEAKYIQARLNNWRQAREEGIDRLLQEHQLDAIFTPSWHTDAPAVGGYPAIIVPAGYRRDGMPFGISFMSKAYKEPDLIRIAYAFEKTVPARRSPML